MDGELDFLKLLEMAKAFSGLNGNEADNGTNAKYYDDVIQTTALKAVKSAIPYLHPNMQRQAGLIVKMYELQSVMRMYDSAQKPAGIYDANQKEWRKGILQSIRPHLTAENRNKIDLLIKLLDMKELLQVMGEFR